MMNVYIGLLLESILFVLLTFVTYYGDQTIETMFLMGVSLPQSWVGFCILGEVISEQSIALSFCVVFELVLGRWYLLKGDIK